MQCAAVTENGTIVTGGEYNTINVWCGGYNPISRCFSKEDGNADIRSVIVLSAERVVTGSAYGQVFLWQREEDATGVAAQKKTKHLEIFVEEKSWDLEACSRRFRPPTSLKALCPHPPRSATLSTCAQA